VNLATMHSDRAGDGGKKARFTRESTKQAVTPLRRKRRTIGLACGDYARVLLPFRTRGCGCGCTPGVSCALCFEGEPSSLGHAVPRECLAVWRRHCERQ